MPSEGEGLRTEDVFDVSGRGFVASGALVPAWGAVLVLGEDGGGGAMVEEHERLHLELNEMTSFGGLLNLLGARIRRAGAREVEVRRRRLARAIALCRTTHEVHATTISLWRTRAAADDALRGYPAYSRYLEFGRALSRGFVERSAGAEYLVATACWAAMQVPLHQLSFDLDDDAQNPAGIAPELQPDHRLQALLDHQRTLDLSWMKAKLPESWLTNPLQAPELQSDPSYHETSIELSIRLYLQFGALLEDLGMPVLEWDGHQRYGSDGFGPGSPVPPLLGDIPDRDSPDYVVRLVRETLTLTDPHYRLKTMERQRLDRRPSSSRLHIGDITSHAVRSETEWDLHDFILQDPTPHVLMVVRPVEAVIAQYRPRAKTESALRKAAIDGVLTALRVTYPGPGGSVPTTGFALLRDHRQLDRVTRLPDGDGFPPNILASVSFSCLRSASWMREWLVPLRALAFPTILFDSLPSAWLAAQEAVGDHDGLAFSTVRVTPNEQWRDSEIGTVNGLAVELLKAEGLFNQWTLFFGGPGLVGALADAILTQKKFPARQDPDRFQPRSIPVSVMSRLAAEEPWFDWDGLRFGPAGRITDPEPDPAALQHCRALAQARRERQERWVDKRKGTVDIELI